MGVVLERRGFLRTTLLAAAALLLRPRLSLALSSEAEHALETESLLYVATRRRSGERSTIKPIWFQYENGEIFFTTSPDTWKAKRIKRGSPLYIWVGSEGGPFLVGTPEPVTDPAVVERMGQAYESKYWIAWMGFFRPRPDRVAEGKTLAFRVKLAEGTPPPPAPGS